MDEKDIIIFGIGIIVSFIVGFNFKLSSKSPNINNYKYNDLKDNDLTSKDTYYDEDGKINDFFD